MTDSRWIKRQKRLPKRERFRGKFAPSVPVLFCINWGTNRVCAGRYDSKHREIEDGSLTPWVSLQGQGFSNREVTHWQPLPAPPVTP